MDFYQLLRFFHFIGFIFLGGGLLAVFVSEWRGYSATRPVIFAEAAFYPRSSTTSWFCQGRS